MAQINSLANAHRLTPAQEARKRTERAVLKGLLLITSLIAMNVWLM
jgi:hypothetical protein